MSGYRSFKLNTAACTSGCQNGGTCSLPEVCTCIPGWTGSNCETGEMMELCMHHYNTFLLKTLMNAMKLINVTMTALM